jgi:HSP20 family protein
MIARWFYDLDPAYVDFNRLTDVMDRVLDFGLPLANIRSVPRGTFPPINVQEKKDGVAIQAYIPGVEPGNIEVTFHDNALTLKGKRDTAYKGTTHRRERFSGEFTRIIGLPEGLDGDKIKAEYRDGLLHITIAKMEERKPKQIPVKIA